MKNAQRRSIFQTLLLSAVYFTAGIGLAALTAVALVRLTSGSSIPAAAYLAERPDRVMRRCLMIYAAIFLWLLLKVNGWQGKHDCGLSDDPQRKISRRWRKRYALGIAGGIATLGSLAAIAGLGGFRIFTPPESWTELPGRAANFLLSGISVGLLEETVCRGMLFRVLARRWGGMAAAFFSSLLFATAHFLDPTIASFQGATFAQIAVQVYQSTLTNFLQEEAFILRFFNLTLMGLASCAIVQWTADIWGSAGLHTGWVWLIKFHHFFTEYNPARSKNLWLGAAADFTDGLLATLLLAALAAFAVARSRAAPALRLWWGKLAWRINPLYREQMQPWFLKNFPEPAVFLSISSLTSRGDGKILKAYDGCLVMALDGVIIKAYYPRPGLRGWRFMLRRNRARAGFALAYALIQAGLPTPPALAWCTRCFCGLRRCEWLLTAEIKNAMPLEALLKQPTLSPKQRAALLESYGAVAALFHIRRYANRDLKHENILVEKETGRLWVVDLDGIRRRFFITRRRAERDLYRVGDCLAKIGAANPADIRAFFEGYNRCVPRRLQRFEFPARS